MPQLVWSCNEYTFSRRHIHLSTGRLARERGGVVAGGGEGGKAVDKTKANQCIFINFTSCSVERRT